MTEIGGPPNVNPLHRASGEAIEAYANVEATQASLLQHILGVTRDQALAVFFSIQNVHAKNELFETLLIQKFGVDIEKYVHSCTAYLFKLAVFRNAIAHWHPLPACM